LCSNKFEFPAPNSKMKKGHAWRENTGTHQFNLIHGATQPCNAMNQVISGDMACGTP
jgi:hypothetical protein